MAVGDDAVCFGVPSEFQKCIGIHGRRGYQTAVTVISGAAAVVGEDILAVILDTDVVAIDKRNACGACLRTEKAVALTVFAQCVG